MADYWRGHPIRVENNHWVYEDGVTVSKDKNRPCGLCNRPNTVEGHDACLGTLPGVMNACCGHGRVEMAYAMFDYQNVLRDEEALKWFEKQKRGPCSVAVGLESSCNG